MEGWGSVLALTHDVKLLRIVRIEKKSELLLNAEVTIVGGSTNKRGLLMLFRRMRGL